MKTYVAFQNTYETVQIALFQDNTLLDFHEAHKHLISKKLIPVLLSFLEHHKIRPQDLCCIIVNNGPSPLTTLRALLSCVNGINFALNISLIAVDGLSLLTKQLSRDKKTAVLLNAFNNDVYYAYPENGSIKSGYQNIDLLLPELAKQQIEAVVGNAIDLHEEKICAALTHAVLDSQISCVKIEDLAEEGITLYETGHTQNEVLPAYTKAPTYPIRNLL